MIILTSLIVLYILYRALKGKVKKDLAQMDADHRQYMSQEMREILDRMKEQKTDD